MEILMKSFNGKQEQYEAWGKQLKAHAEADELVQGIGWDNGKGCFIGCSIHEYSHQKFAKLFDVPQVIPKLADTLFETADESEAKGFALAIWESMQVGVDYTNFTHHWHHWLVSDLEQGVVRFSNHPNVNAVGLLHLKAQTELVTQEEWMEAGKKVYAVSAAASAAARAAEDAAASAARAARAAYDASASAARAAYYASASAARAAYYATYDASGTVGWTTAKAQQRVKFLELLGSPVFPKVS